jgi:hypothetical protein
MGGANEEAEPVQLLLDLPLRLVIAQRRGGVVIAGVIVEVAEGGEEGALLSFGLLIVLVLECVLVESSLGLVLAGGVLMFVLVLVVIMLAKGVLLLGAVGDKVVEVTIAEAALLRTTAPAVHALLRNHENQLMISASSSSPSTSNYSSVTEAKEEKQKQLVMG